MRKEPMEEQVEKHENIWSNGLNRNRTILNRDRREWCLQNQENRVSSSAKFYLHFGSVKFSPLRRQLK